MSVAFLGVNRRLERVHGELRRGMGTEAGRRGGAALARASGSSEAGPCGAWERPRPAHGREPSSTAWRVLNSGAKVGRGGAGRGRAPRRPWRRTRRRSGRVCFAASRSTVDSSTQSAREGSGRPRRASVGGGAHRWRQPLMVRADPAALVASLAEWATARRGTGDLKHAFGSDEDCSAQRHLLRCCGRPSGAKIA